MPLNSYISLRQGSAYLAAIVLVALPLTVYCDFRAALGNWPLVKLLAVAGVGGSITFALWAKASERRLAIVPGFVAGIGAVAAHAFLLAPLNQCPEFNVRSSTALFVVGSIPGFLLLWVFRSHARKLNNLTIRPVN